MLPREQTLDFGSAEVTAYLLKSIYGREALKASRHLSIEEGDRNRPRPQTSLSTRSIP